MILEDERSWSGRGWNRVWQPRWNAERDVEVVGLWWSEAGIYRRGSFPAPARKLCACYLASYFDERQSIADPKKVSCSSEW